MTTETAVSLAQRVLELHRQQRSLSHPVLVHCDSGSGRTSLLLLLLAAMAEVDVCRPLGDNGPILPDLTEVASRVCAQRKGALLADRDSLRQAFQGVALYCKELLVARGAISFAGAPPPVEATNPPRSAPSPMSDPMMARLVSDLSLGPGGGGGGPVPAPRQRTTKQEFSDSSRAGLGSGRDSNPDDPLSQLDPLWSLK